MQVIYKSGDLTKFTSIVQGEFLSKRQIQKKHLPQI